jgi:hypothetical protein
MTAGGSAGGAAGGSSAGGAAGGAMAGGAAGGMSAGGGAGGSTAGGAAGGVAGGDAGGTAGGSMAGGAAGGSIAGGAGGGSVGGGAAGGAFAGGFGGGVPPVDAGAGGGSAICAMDTEACSVTRPCCGLLRCVPGGNNMSFCTSFDGGICLGQGATCITGTSCCPGLACSGSGLTCEPIARDAGVCLGLGATCTTSSVCCNGCCSPMGVCSNFGPCVLSAPLQCQTQGAFCNPDSPTRRCCMPPLVPALQCLQPSAEACSTGADCCSGCCQGRPGIGLCSPASVVPDGHCQ